MEEIIKSEATKEKNETKKSNIIINILMNILAVFFWVYFIIKVFIFDFDVYLINRFSPDYIWIVQYKLFIILGALSAVWAFTKNKNIIMWTLFVIFYPIIIMFVMLPVYLFKIKGWNLAIAIISAVITFFKNIKYNFIVSSIYLIAALIVIRANTPPLLWGSIIVLLTILLITFTGSFLSIFKPPNVFKLFSDMIDNSQDFTLKSCSLDENIKGMEKVNYNEAQLQTWTTNLQSAVIFNKLYYFLAVKLKNYQNSKYNVVSYVITMLKLISLTILSFTFIHLALFKMYPNAFAVAPDIGIFNFFYYSFKSLHLSGIDEIKAIRPLSQGMLICEQIFSFFLGSILFALMLNVGSEKHSKEIDETIRKLSEKEKLMESFIQTEYKLDVINAIKELEQLKAGSVSFIYMISKDIE